MFIKSVLTLTISYNMLTYPNCQFYELKGDYSDEANRYMQQNCYKTETFDPNDILYKVIAKELENEKANDPEVDK